MDVEQGERAVRLTGHKDCHAGYDVVCFTITFSIGRNAANRVVSVNYTGLQLVTEEKLAD